MKILHVFHHSNLLNGVDRSTITLLRGWQELGNVNFGVLVPSEGEVTNTLDTMGIQYRVAPLNCCNGPSLAAERKYLATTATRAKQIENWLMEENFDLIHLNTGHLLDGVIAGNRAQVPVIWHIHSPFEVDYARYSNFIKPETYAWLLGQLGDHVLAVSDDVRNGLLPWMPNEKISTLYNGVDVEGITYRAKLHDQSLRKQLKLNESTPLVLGVGRISAQKDFATFVRVAKFVVDNHQTACFAIAGPAEESALANELHVLIDQLDLKGRCFILGPRTDVPVLLDQCDAFLSTAVYEGQGIAALEAMALKKPVIAMNCIGLRECIQNEIDGLLVELGDIKACGAAILRVLSNQSLADSLGAQGRSTVETKFSGIAHAKRFFEIADKVVSNYSHQNNQAPLDIIIGLLNKISEADKRISQSNIQPSISRRLINHLKRHFP